MRAAFLAGLAGLAGLIVGAAPERTAGPITPADIMTLKDMREAEVSPDGRTVLFTVLDRMATFSPEASGIWAVPADGSSPARPFIVSAGVDEHPRWSPDGRSVAFLSNRKNPLAGGRDTGFEFKADTGTAPGTPGDAATPPPAAGAPGEPSRQLWLLPVAGGEAVPLTALPNDISDFAWSPDGTRLAFLSADPDTPAEKADKAAKRDGVVVDGDHHMTRLWVLDLATHAARRLSPDGLNVSALDWSPDGRRLALRVADTPRINDFFYHSRIVLFDPETRVVGPALLDHTAGGPHWSPDGRALLTSEILSPGFIGLAPRVVDVASGRVTRLADDHRGTVTDPAWSADGRTVLALSFEGTRSKLVRIDPRGGAVTPLFAYEGEAANFTTSRDGRVVAAAVSSPDRPADVWVSRGSGAARAVTRINPRVAGWRLGTVKEIGWKSSRDGRTIFGVLVLPPGYRAGTPVKTVVQVHGGPEWAWWSGWLGSWHEWAQMLASHGYAVLLPNPRGSDGQGTEFARAVGHDWGGADYQDVLDGVDRLVADKVADPARLGIGGWSYGGFMAAWAVTHGDRFKAAVAGAAPSDLAAFATITDTPDFPLGYFGDPATHLADLDAHSSARMLGAVHTPLLVLHGAEDTRVPPVLGLELYRGLRLLGKPAEMVRYPGEPHWFHDRAHQEDVQRRVLAWFDRYL